MIRELNVSQATPIGDQQIDEGILRVVATPIPQFVGPENEWRPRYEQFYNLQAASVMCILELLPGGTLDRVLIRLLTRYASLHTIPWGAESEPARS